MAVTWCALHSCLCSPPFFPIFYTRFFPPGSFQIKHRFYLCLWFSLPLPSFSFPSILSLSHPSSLCLISSFVPLEWLQMSTKPWRRWLGVWENKLAGNRLTNVRARLIGWDFYEWNGHMHTYYIPPNKFDLAGGKSSLQHSNHDRWLTSCLSHSRILSLPLSASPTLPHPLSQRETINGTLHVTEAWPG